jgi:hypothetical protein
MARHAVACWLALPLGGVGGVAPSGQRDEVVLADALQDEEGRGTLAGIRHQVGTAGAHGVGLAGREPDLVLGIAQEQP